MNKRSLSKSEYQKYSPDWLRQFKGYEHYTDEQATSELNSIDLLADMLLKFTSRNKK